MTGTVTVSFQGKAGLLTQDFDKSCFEVKRLWRKADEDEEHDYYAHVRGLKTCLFHVFVKVYKTGEGGARKWRAAAGYVSKEAEGYGHNRNAAAFAAIKAIADGDEDGSPGSDPESVKLYSHAAKKDVTYTADSIRQWSKYSGVGIDYLSRARAVDALATVTLNAIRDEGAGGWVVEAETRDGKGTGRGSSRNAAAWKALKDLSRATASKRAIRAESAKESALEDADIEEGETFETQLSEYLKLSRAATDSAFNRTKGVGSNGDLQALASHFPTGEMPSFVSAASVVDSVRTLHLGTLPLFALVGSDNGQYSDLSYEPAYMLLEPNDNEACSEVWVSIVNETGEKLASFMVNFTGCHRKEARVRLQAAITVTRMIVQPFEPAYCPAAFADRHTLLSAVMLATNKVAHFASLYNGPKSGHHVFTAFLAYLQHGTDFVGALESVWGYAFPPKMERNYTSCRPVRASVYQTCQSITYTKGAQMVGSSSTFMVLYVDPYDGSMTAVHKKRGGIRFSPNEIGIAGAMPSSQADEYSDFVFVDAGAISGHFPIDPRGNEAHYPDCYLRPFDTFYSNSTGNDWVTVVYSDSTSVIYEERKDNRVTHHTTSPSSFFLDVEGSYVTEVVTLSDDYSKDRTKPGRVTRVGKHGRYNVFRADITDEEVGETYVRYFGSLNSAIRAITDIQDGTTEPKHFVKIKCRAVANILEEVARVVLPAGRDPIYKVTYVETYYYLLRAPVMVMGKDVMVYHIFGVEHNAEDRGALTAMLDGIDPVRGIKADRPRLYLGNCETLREARLRCRGYAGYHSEEEELKAYEVK